MCLSVPLSRPPVKEFRDHAEQQHIAAQQKAALQVTTERSRGLKFSVHVEVVHKCVVAEKLCDCNVSARARSLFRLLHHTRLLVWKPDPPRVASTRP